MKAPVMKHAIVPLLFTTLLVSCVSFLPYRSTSYRLMEVDSCAVGEALISVCNGYIPSTDSTNFFGYEAELVYTGTSGSVIHLTYREYETDIRGTYIRPAFSLPIMYDLSTDKHIVFRKYAIDIIDASSSRCVFRVVRDNYSVRTELRASHTTPPVVLLPVDKRRHVRIRTAGGSLDVFIVAETDSKYYVSKEREPTDSPGGLPKTAVLEISDLPN